KIEQKIIEFHERISPSEFVELQYKCRKLWQEKLSPEGFFSNFYRHFQIL
ncbi:exostosin, partial [Brunnivagina elsteri CCALA 953]